MNSLLLVLLLWVTAPDSSGQPHGQSEWHFTAIYQGVKFYWREEPTWHHIEIKTENNWPSSINFDYDFDIRQGNTLLYQGRHQWIRLRSNDVKVLKIPKDFGGVSHVQLSNIHIEVYR